MRMEHNTVEIKWTNLIAFALALFALVIVLTMPRTIVSFLATMKNIGPGHTPEEQTLGLIAFGLLLVTIVALARIAASRRSGEDR